MMMMIEEKHILQKREILWCEDRAILIIVISSLCKIYDTCEHKQAKEWRGMNTKKKLYWSFLCGARGKDFSKHLLQYLILMKWLHLSIFIPHTNSSLFSSYSYLCWTHHAWRKRTEKRYLRSSNTNTHTSNFYHHEYDDLLRMRRKY